MIALPLYAECDGQPDGSRVEDCGQMFSKTEVQPTPVVRYVEVKWYGTRSLQEPVVWYVVLISAGRVEVQIDGYW